MVSSRHCVRLLLASATFLLVSMPKGVHAGYEVPPEPLLTLMRTLPPPQPLLDPTRQRVLLVQQAQYPSIERVAEPYLKLAGLRIEPRNHSRHDMSSGYGIRTCLHGLTLQELASGQQTPVVLPENACISTPVFSPDGRRFAFSNTTASDTELWLGDALTGQVRRVEGMRLNPILEGAVNWLQGSRSLLVKRLPEDIGPAPRPAISPEIRDATQGGGESSTYEARDMLGSPADELLFDYYVHAQLAVLDVDTGQLRNIGTPGALAALDVAPDGRHVRVERLLPPYSYVTTWQRFAREVSVLDVENGTQTVIAQLPVADRVPVRGVPEGPRSYSWQANAPASLIWAEALDKGDLKVEVPHRDRLLRWEAPFTGQPVEVARTRSRYAGTRWLAEGDQPFVYEHDANRQWIRVSRMDFSAPTIPAEVVWEYSQNEVYANPGTLLMQTRADGSSVVLQEGEWVYLAGPGGTPKGDRPFLDRYSLTRGKTERVFRSGSEGLEQAFAVLPGGQTFITTRQSPSSPPNLYQRRIGRALQALEGEAQYASRARALTQIVDPTPEVRGIGKQLVTYTRKDGVALSFTLYTPPGYRPGTRLPAILYAYPQDFADPSKAGQISGSEQRFDMLRGHRLLLLAGYAIIDNAAFPIVGDPRTAYDTYTEQLVMNAEAAIDKAVELGVVDRNRIGVTGHSHGALMTANLLAHTDLFRAGVASAGGYNKTLTPFGFQNERRSLWTAAPVYEAVSSYQHADKINEPLLIVHGSDDANPGTEPIQSPKLFQAIRGLGGTTRLVMLPHEPHWFTARQSNEHFVHEMLSWFDRYVKNAAPVTSP